MAEVTIFVKEAVDGKPIQEIESILTQMDGMERVLIDTSDGEVKVQFNEEKVTAEQIATTLREHNYHYNV
ncbi:hypothetical protein [Paraliobacillus zengyii]|uniref:hypothetical protein n=1 Tax=Paraliobacillus zengyii TaxID=2213194 RepID=UPI000DD4ABA6|nr:hypothetical protein [Paraliobacillus zengyii]